MSGKEVSRDHTNDFFEILRPNALDLRLQQSIMLGVLPYLHLPVHPLSELCRETCCICFLPGCRQGTCSALIPFGNICACTSRNVSVKATDLYVQARLSSIVSLFRNIIVLCTRAGNWGRHPFCDGMVGGSKSSKGFSATQAAALRKLAVQTSSLRPEIAAARGEAGAFGEIHGQLCDVEYLVSPQHSGYWICAWRGVLLRV